MREGAKTQGLLSPSPLPGSEQESDRQALGAQSRSDGAGDSPSPLAAQPPPCSAPGSDRLDQERRPVSCQGRGLAHGTPQPLPALAEVPWDLGSSGHIRVTLGL